MILSLRNHGSNKLCNLLVWGLSLIVQSLLVFPELRQEITIISKLHKSFGFIHSRNAPSKEKASERISAGRTTGRCSPAEQHLSIAAFHFGSFEMARTLFLVFYLISRLFSPLDWHVLHTIRCVNIRFTQPPHSRTNNWTAIVMAVSCHNFKCVRQKIFETGTERM